MTKGESRCDGRHGTREVEGTVMVSWNMECWEKKQVRGREQFKKKKTTTIRSVGLVAKDVDALARRSSMERAKRRHNSHLI